MNPIDLPLAFGGVNEVESDQSPQEFDFAMNMELWRGSLEARRGFTVMGKKWTDTFTPDPGQTIYTQPHNITAATYVPTLAAVGPAVGLGAKAVRVGGRELRFIVVRAVYVSSAWNIIVYIYDEVGDPVGAPTNLTSTFGESASYSTPVIFSEAWDKVYFTKGDGIYAWDIFARDQVKRVEFVQHPIYPTDAFWITSRLKAKVLLAHRDRMFYAGLPDDLPVVFSGSVLNTDDSAAIAVAAKGDAPAIYDAARTSGVFFGAHLLWSEPGFPNTVRHSSFWANPEDEPIVALAEFQEKVIVWTENAMWLWDGDGLENWQVRKIHASAGCASQRSVCTLNNGLLCWAARDGIFTFDGETVQNVSDKISKTWRFGGFSSFPRVNNDLRKTIKQVHLPWQVNTTRLDWSCAAHRSIAGQYWLAVTTQSGPVPNNVIVVWDYRQNRWWYHATLEKDESERSVTGLTGFDALITDVGSAGSLYVLGRSSSYISDASKKGDQRFGSWLGEHAGTDDQGIVFDQAGNAIRTKTRVPMLIVGARQLIEPSVESVAAVLWMRVYGTHSQSFNGDEADQPVVIAFPEFAAVDALRASTSDLREIPVFGRTFAEFEDSVLADPTKWTARYFWQPKAKQNAAYNVWDSTTTPLDSTLNPTLKWLARDVAEVRVQLPQFPSHWFRICLYDAPVNHPHRLRMISWQTKAALTERSQA